MNGPIVNHLVAASINMLVIGGLGWLVGAGHPVAWVPLACLFLVNLALAYTAAERSKP